MVGMNGSGKTTFIKLLCRLYDPTQGEILLNGVDIRKYNYHEYMQLFSVVFQDFRLLSFELAQNVTGSINVDLDRADQCLRDAGFGIRLDKLPQGLSTASFCRLCHDSQNHEILVFHEGRLIQRGSHEVLVSDRSGMYYRLWSAQAQYYEVE